MKISYPVIFTEYKSNILFEVPDLGIMSEAAADGKTASVEQAIEMARDAIGIAVVNLEDNDQTVPESSKINEINAEEGSFCSLGLSYCSLVDVDVNEYRWQLENRMERCNLTLQHKLKRAAEKSHLNLSALLQKAVREELNM